MTLPKIETPKYFLTIPSTEESIEYRPFLVKEEKVLMIAQEAGTDASMIAAMKDIINACTFNKLDLYSLTMSDLEYILLQIRSKSVGETAEIRVKCDESGEFVKVTLDLSEVNVTKEDGIDNNIKITDDVGIVLKSPGLKDAERAARGRKNTNPFIQALSSVIENVYDNDTVYPLSDASSKEIENFIESLTTDQVKKIKEWIDSSPSLKHEIEFEGPNGHKNKKVLSGLNDFFI
jgi:hypothetical protein